MNSGVTAAARLLQAPLATVLVGWLAGPVSVVAIVGGAPYADPAIARHVVLVHGRTSACSGAVIAPDLVVPQ